MFPLVAEPTSVDLHVDGVSDICTKEEDINFVFTGFSVLGTVRTLMDSLLHQFNNFFLMTPNTIALELERFLVCIQPPKTNHCPVICVFSLCDLVQVLSKGHLLGPAGVEVKLTRAGTDEKLQSVVTQPGGK